MSLKVKKLITRIGTGVMFIAVGILEYKFSTMPIVANVIIDLVMSVSTYFGLKILLPSN